MQDVETFSLVQIRHKIYRLIEAYIAFYIEVYCTICRGEIYFETSGQEEEKKT